MKMLSFRAKAGTRAGSLKALSLGGGKSACDVVETLQKAATQGDRVCIGDQP